MPPAPQRSEPRVLKASDNLWCHVVSTQAAPQAGVPDLARKNPLSTLALNESLFCLYSALTEKSHSPVRVSLRRSRTFQEPGKRLKP